MRKLFLTFILALFPLTGFANAEERDEYIGIKAGLMTVDADVQGVDIDDMNSAGIVYGYDITKEFAVEGELNLQISGGDAEISGYSGGMDIWTLAVYGVYRHQFSNEAFVKFKAGVLHENIEIKVWVPFVGPVREDGTDTGFSAGVGLGRRFSELFSGEIEYTIIEEDIDYLSLGINFHF